MDLEAWIVESLRRGEKVVVVIMNETTKEEVRTTMDPAFVACAVGICRKGEIRRRGEIRCVTDR